MLCGGSMNETNYDTKKKKKTKKFNHVTFIHYYFFQD